MEEGAGVSFAVDVIEEEELLITPKFSQTNLQLNQENVEILKVEDSYSSVFEE